MSFPFLFVRSPISCAQLTFDNCKVNIVGHVEASKSNVTRCRKFAGFQDGLLITNSSTGEGFEIAVFSGYIAVMRLLSAKLEQLHPPCVM